MEEIIITPFLTKDFQTTEAIKALRTNLLFSGSHIRSVALTSYGPSEGKSTISFHLAASLALTGKRVLLLDADLRKSVLAHRLHVHGNIPGLTHVLSGLAPLSECLRPTDLQELQILFAGARISGSAELLGGEPFHLLMDTLQARFDYIVVDAPPLGQVIDCALLAPAMDGVVMVIDTTHNSYKLQRRVKAQLEKAGANILGVVLNRVNFQELGGYYGRFYGYGYEE